MAVTVTVAVTRRITARSGAIVIVVVVVTVETVWVTADQQ